MRALFKQPLFASLLAGSLVLSGCSAIPLLGGNPSGVTLPSGKDGSSEPPELEVFDTSDGRVLATEGNLDDSGFIETAPKTLFSEEITTVREDKHGNYAVTKIDYPSIDSVQNDGVSKAILGSALEFYTDFVATEVIDSIAFDDFSRYGEWVKDVAPKYFAPEYLDILSSAQNTNNPAAVIFNNHDPNVAAGGKNLLPVLARDGKPRVFNKSIWGLQARPVDGGIYLWGMGSATLITDDKKGIEWYSILTGNNSGAGFDFYNDGKPNASQLVYQVGLTLIKDGESWKIAGYSNSFTKNSFEFFKAVPLKIINWRNSVK